MATSNAAGLMTANQWNQLSGLESTYAKKTDIPDVPDTTDFLKKSDITHAVKNLSMNLTTRASDLLGEASEATILYHYTGANSIRIMIQGGFYLNTLETSDIQILLKADDYAFVRLSSFSGDEDLICVEVRSIDNSEYWVGINEFSWEGDAGITWYLNGKGMETIDNTVTFSERITTMEKMFSNCGISKIDLSKLEMGKVTNMNSMFIGCQYLEEVDLSNFDTTNVTDMKYIFSECYNLKSIKVANCSDETINMLLTNVRAGEESSTKQWHRDGDYILP